MFKLRDYQEECLETIITKARTGTTKQVVVLATGLGKTVIFGHLPSKVKAKGKKTLIIAHREELLIQAKKKLGQIDPGLVIGIEQGKNSIDDVSLVDVVVASVQTIGRKGSERIKKFDPKDFGLIIIDECHHATASTYMNVLEYFGALKGKPNNRKNIVLLGVTATPNRSDHVGLDKVFDAITFSYTLRKGIENKYLSNIRAYTVRTHTDLSHVHTRGGDFIDKELAEAIDTEERNKLVVDSYLDICPNEKALVFAANVAHVENLTKYFKSMDVPTEYIIGATDSDKRREILDKYTSGEIKVLINCAVLTEGFDEPSIQAVFMARPTKSSVAYSQMIGRGTRLYEGKESLKLVDFVDNTGKNSVASLPALMGVKVGPLKVKGKLITETVEQLEKILDLHPDFDFSDIDDWSEENINKIVEEIDIFAHAQIPEEVKENSQFTWGNFADGYRLKFPKQETTHEEVRIMKNMLSQYEVTHFVYEAQIPSQLNNYKKWKKTSESVIITGKDIAKVFEEADVWVEENQADSSSMFKQTAKWRKDGASEKQLALLKKFHVAIPKQGLLKGEASILIDKALNGHKLNRKK